MSAAKHTPGPWQIDETTYPQSVTDASGCFVAECARDEDARLIHTAPAMAEALASLIAFDAHVTAGAASSNEYDRVIARARAALKEAGIDDA